MRHIRLMVLAFVAALALSAISVASAVAVEPPELLQTGKVEIPEKTPVTASGTNPVLKGKGSEIKCESVETVEGGTHKNNGEVIGKTEKEISIRLLFTGCAEVATKAKCTTKEQEAGHILTELLTVKLVSKKVGETLVGGAITVGPKGGFTETLATFTCGEKAVTVTGCVPAKVELTESGKMMTGTSESEATIGTEKCEEKTFGAKSEQKSVETFSYNKEGKLLTLELVI